MPKSLGLSRDELRSRRNIRAREQRKTNPEQYRSYDRKRYCHNKSARLERNKRWREENKQKAYEISRKTLARLETIKTANPCIDCGHRFPPECIDFDHRPGTNKVEGVGHMIACRYSWSRIEAEIAKCDIVCSNCHRTRTKRRHLEKRCQSTTDNVKPVYSLK